MAELDTIILILRMRKLQFEEIGKVVRLSHPESLHCASSSWEHEMRDLESNSDPDCSTLLGAVQAT